MSSQIKEMAKFHPCQMCVTQIDESKGRECELGLIIGVRLVHTHRVKRVVR